MSKLVKLELQDNKLSTGLSFIADRCPNLEILKLTNNFLSSVAEIAKLAPLRVSLYTLELLGNPICEINKYAERIFKALPGLEVLDGVDRDGNEVMSDDEDVNED